MKTRPAAEEATLVERAIAGSTDAFGELYLLHLDPIYRYIYYRIGEVADAEDLTEQVFLKAWEALPGYRRSRFPFSSWLYRIAHNCVVDFHRRQKLHSPVPLDERVTLDGDPASTLKQVIEFEESASLIKAIAQLPDEQQQVIILRFVEGLSHAEIARIIGKNEGASRMLQHRALAVLSQILCVQR